LLDGVDVGFVALHGFSAWDRIDRHTQLVSSSAKKTEEISQWG
jgi:hypothetical protein